MANSIKELVIKEILNDKWTDEELKSIMKGVSTLSKEQQQEIYNKMKLKESMVLISRIKDGDEYDQVMEEIENMRNTYFSKVKTMENARKKKKQIIF